MIDNNTGRTWSNAPRGVREVRTLAWLAVVVTGILFILALVLLGNPSFGIGMHGGPMVFFYALCFPLYVWLLRGLKRGI